MKRNKKHNPNKLKQTPPTFAVKGLALLMRLDISNGMVNGYNYNTFKPKNITTLHASVIGHARFNWTIVLVVWSTESNGKERITTRLVQSPYPANHVELITSLNDVHQDMIHIENTRNNDPHNAAWVAYPETFGKLTDEDTEHWIDTSLTLLGHYNDDTC